MMMNPEDRLSNDTLAIFLFHGVIQPSRYNVRNYTRKHLEKDHFASVIRKLKKKGCPLSINRAVEYISSGRRFPPRSFIITFDDGFENNFSIAAPILVDMNIPATFYLTTDFIQNNTMSWIDRIEYCMEAMPSGSVLLPWRETKIPFTGIEDKIEILDEIRGRAKKDPDINFDSFVTSIFEQTGMDQIKHSDDQLDKKMTWEQVCQLSGEHDFTIGGHSHTHAILSHLCRSDLEEELSTSINLIKKNTNILPKHYSYPEGMAHCYSETVIEALKGHGIICCPTAMDGTNHNQSDLFHLRRIMVS